MTAIKKGPEEDVTKELTKSKLFQRYKKRFDTNLLSCNLELKVPKITLKEDSKPKSQICKITKITLLPETQPHKEV